MGQAGQMGKSCKCPHHMIMPIAIILFGLSFLLTNLGVMTVAANNIVWPVIVILVGLKKTMRCKCC